MGAGLLCIAAALALTIYYLLTEQQSDRAAQDVLIQLNQQIVHEPPRQEENTAGLIIADQDGHEIDWPLQESGMPMPWPVDHDGRPQAVLTDAFDNVYIWHYELNRPMRDFSGEGSGRTPMPDEEPASTPTAIVSQAPTMPPAVAESQNPTITPAVTETQSPTMIPGISVPPISQDTVFTTAEPTVAPEPGMDAWQENTALPIAAVSPTHSARGPWQIPNGLLGNNQSLTNPTQSVGFPQTMPIGGSGEGRTYTWTVDPSGNLLPYASDNLGRVIPWMTDQAGKALRMELLAQLWQLLLKQLNANLQEFLSKPAFVLNPDMEMPVTALKGHDYIGILDIPCQNVSLPVMSEWSYAKLKIAPCRYSGSVYSGDVILAGHNSNGHFSPIKKLVTGDEVRFTDADGNVFIYSVMRIDVLGANDVQLLLAGDEEWDLSMFTCSHNSRKRTTVRCKLESYIAAE